MMVYGAGADGSARQEAANGKESFDSRSGISDFTGDVAGVWESCGVSGGFAGTGDEGVDWTEVGGTSMDAYCQSSARSGNGKLRDQEAAKWLRRGRT